MTDTPHFPRRHRGEPDKIPPVLLRGMFGLVAVCLAMVTAYVLTGQQTIATPPAAEVIYARTVTLEADMSGAARVLDESGAVIADLAADEGGFVSGVARVIARERTKHRVALNAPVRIEINAANRLSIHDDTTGWSADLMGFGQDNAKAFARLLR